MTFVGERVIAGLAERHGVPLDVAQELSGLLRPSVLLVRHEDLPGGVESPGRPAGRTGGLPSLPEGVEWPAGAGPFALAVDCASLPGGCLDIALPPDGRLVFFTSFRYEPERSAVLHVPAGVPTTERVPPEGMDDQEIVPHEPHSLYAVAGLTIDHDWDCAPATRAFGDSAPDRDEVLEGFVEAVVNSVHSGPAPHAVAQIGGFSRQWQVPPDQDGLVLLIQIAGNGVDETLFTLNLAVGTREDIAARRWEKIEWEQQC
ncbi:DUF1963 domain-containing protein [Lentzea rhizosphaerae]|uniref:DUF1963 domain-containing protein n=1 Tax=Lentzea rhizosphaerae TaxID=2041025 RepID=A0ABV8BNN5_9PSEU